MDGKCYVVLYSYYDDVVGDVTEVDAVFGSAKLAYDWIDIRKRRFPENLSADYKVCMRTVHLDDKLIKGQEVFLEEV